MKSVRVMLFARARELAGAESLSLAMPDAATVADLRRELIDRCPALTSLLPRCAVAINGNFADDAAEIPPDAELAVLPPVSGG
jgi:molybdopterin converting factor subunit 1